MSDDEEDGPEDASISKKDIVEKARSIAKEYYDQDLKLTVRQLYYQFVAQGLLPSGQKVYKRVVNALSEARVAGDFPMDMIEDRGRDAQPGDFTHCDDDVDDALTGAANTIGNLPEIYLKYGRWFGQPNFVSVWVEKEALAGVFEAPCRELGVGLFACRGYPSVSSLYQWLLHAKRATSGEDPESVEDDAYESGMHAGKATSTTILYFGDHDPDGMEIPKSSLRTMEEMLQNNIGELEDCQHPEVFPLINVVRVALNMDQIRRYRPPPFDAKKTSSRYARYFREHRTEDAWELDALNPTILNNLIRTSVAGYWDEGIFERNKATILERRAALRKKMRAGSWLKDAVGRE